MTIDMVAPNDYRRAIFDWAGRVNFWATPRGERGEITIEQMDLLDAAIQKCVQRDHERAMEAAARQEQLIRQLENSAEQFDERIQELLTQKNLAESARTQAEKDLHNLEEKLQNEQTRAQLRDQEFNTYNRKLWALREEATKVLDGKTDSHVQAARKFAEAIVELVGRHVPEPAKPSPDPPAREGGPCLDPDKMLGAGDQFPGSDYE